MTTPPPGDMTPPPPPGGMPPSGGLLGPANDDDKTMALLCHLGSIIGTILLPLIIMLTKKESPFVQQEAKEALNFQIMSTVLGIFTCGLFYIVMIIFGIMAVLQAKDGVPYRYPFNVRLIK